MHLYIKRLKIVLTPWKDHFIQFILQIVVLIFHAENLIKKKNKKKKKNSAY